MKEKRLEVTMELVQKVCALYDSAYNDMEEDSSPGGKDFLPGKTAGHKSLKSFQSELAKEGISLSTTKIRKILITGGIYSTQTSRLVAEYYDRYGDIAKVAKEMRTTKAAVDTYLPYQKTAYGLENKTANARRVEKSKKKYTERRNPNFVPYLYVLDTGTGNEKKVKKLLINSMGISDQEKNEFMNPGQDCIFIPETVFTRHVKNKNSDGTGEDVNCYKTVFPGCVFLYSWHLSELCERTTASEGGYVLRKMLQPDLKSSLESLFARLSPEEEKMIFDLCSVQKNRFGRLERKSRNIAGRIEVDTGSPHPFTIGISHGDKYVRKNSLPGQRKEGDLHMVMIDGPLKGHEDRIVCADAHKRKAVVRVTLAGKVYEIAVPFEQMRIREG